MFLKKIFITISRYPMYWQRLTVKDDKFYNIVVNIFLVYRK